MDFEVAESKSEYYVKEKTESPIQFGQTSSVFFFFLISKNTPAF